MAPSNEEWPVRKSDKMLSIRNVNKRLEEIKEYFSPQELDKLRLITDETINLKNIRNQLEHANLAFDDPALSHVFHEYYDVIETVLNLFHQKISDLRCQNKLQNFEGKHLMHKNYWAERKQQFIKDELDIIKHLRCVSCSSGNVEPEKTQLKIAKNKFTCCYCNKKFEFTGLVNQLINSTSIQKIYETIEPWTNFPQEIYSCLESKQLNSLITGISNNDKITCLKGDKRIADVISKIITASQRKKLIPSYYIYTMQI